MRVWASFVAVVLSTAAVAHASGFYGTIRISNDGIPGSGVALSANLVDFLDPAGPPNGQGRVEYVASVDFVQGPVLGSTVLVKDFVPGSFVTSFLTFDAWTGSGYNGTTVPPRWPAWDSLPVGFPPDFINPSGCVPNPSPFCVMDAAGGSIAFFELRGDTSNQLGYWEALFGVRIPQYSAAEVRAMLEGGQTVVSSDWTADIATGPEPATSTVVVMAIGLLILVRRRHKVLGAR